MLKKHNRILWLLNHKTLMPFEVGLMRELGFEVFTPKVTPDPKTGFRSGMVDFSHDASLTLPPKVLARLNQFNFYEDAWPPDIVRFVNRYFGTAFIMPVARQVSEAVRKFEGRIVFRTFGLEDTKSYKFVLDVMYGAEIFSRIYAIHERFWFGEGYEQLHECEPPLLAERAVHLPIGVPTSFWKTEGKWTGSVKKILFVCPNMVTNPYYNAIYRQFKEDFGDLPHVIIGAQDEPVDDPHVLGFVSNEELERLYVECAVLYYHSTEKRHVHYSPIEAAINGMPVVYYRNSLLGRMTGDEIEGAVDNVQSARAIIERILADDQPLIQRLRASQRTLAHQFSKEYCEAKWRTGLLAMGLHPVPAPEPLARVLGREAGRLALAPWGKGMLRKPPRVPGRQPSRFALQLPSEPIDESTLADGIDFRAQSYPGFVREITGISGQEFWGRWSDAKKVRICLYDELQGKFRLLLTGGAYGKNLGAPFKVRIGKLVRSASFSVDPHHPETVELEFELQKPANTIEITVPRPMMPPNDNRQIGLGFVSMRMTSDK
jgi:hypothetical protein